MRILDSRRLTGPNLLLDGPGAILEAALDGVDPTQAIAAWRNALALLLGQLGWPLPVVARSRVHAQGVSVAFAAEPDVLYAATEINEAAWDLSLQAIGRGEDGAAHAPDVSALSATIARLRDAIARERKPWLLRLDAEAKRRGVTLLADDKRISVGLGSGSRAWPEEETPQVMDRIPWPEIHDVPIALVTGTNGKTTTVRLLTEMARASGRTAGATSTDDVTVGDDVVAEGDYSGPNGARTVLRDRRVEIAMLEVARGGILRRGLAVTRAQAALVTNVANDHLGEFGIFDLDTLADVKLVVAKVVPASGRLVLNADDSRLLARGSNLTVPVTWFTLDPGHAGVAASLARGGDACVLEDDLMTFRRGDERLVVADVRETPIAFGGAARHNVANALGAIGVAMALGLPVEAIRQGLRSFGASHASNPGRANVWKLRDVTAIVDFAHNPHGLRALADLSLALPARRRAIVIGQAGDRDDESIRDLARAAASARPDHVFLKEMDVYLRGRERGAVSALIEDELRRGGVRSESITRCDSELEAVRAALAWARSGDLLVLTTHAQRDEVIELLEGLTKGEWKPGDPIEAPRG